MLGGDIRTQRGGMDAGITWVNQYRTDSFKSLDESTYKGTLPTTGRAPEWIVVRVADQTPEDLNGVHVRRAQMRINGVAVEHQLAPHDKLNPEQYTLTVTEHVGDLLIPPVRRDNSNDLVIEFNHAEPSPEGLYSLQGEESALFWFRVPGYVTTMGDTAVVDQVSVDFDVSGDYTLELAEVFNGASANPATYFYRAAYADGNPSDQ